MMQLESKIFGTGHRLFVGLHGWGGNADTFAPLEPWLPDDARILSISLPGYGSSLKPDVWSLTAVTDSVLSVMSEIDEPYTLIGNCSGAIFGMLAALQLPSQKIQRMVVIDAFAYMPWYLELFVWPVVGPLFYWSSFANPIGRWLTQKAFEDTKRERADMTASFATIDHGVTYEMLKLLSKVGDYRQFQGLCMPIDIVFGRHSFQAIHHSARLWSRLWPHAQVCCLEGGGHLLLEEETETISLHIFSRMNNADTVERT